MESDLTEEEGRGRARTVNEREMTSKNVPYRGENKSINSISYIQ